MPRVMSLFHSILALLIISLPVAAEPVSVNRGKGLGFVFSHNGNCFLVLPAHVPGRQTRLSVTTTAPSAVGDAVLVRNLSPAVDLSLFIVSSGLEQRCDDSFADLSDDIQPVLDRGGDLQLIRVDTSGAELRDPMTITAVDFSTLTARPVNPAREAELYQGSSGGILKSRNTVIGMALQSTDIAAGTFLRMDEIVNQIRRIVTPNRAVETAPQPVEGAAGVVSQCPVGTLPIVRVSCTIEPSDPAFACSNLLTEAAEPVAFPPGAQPRIVLDLAGDQATALEAVTLMAPADQSQFAVPQQVTVEVSSTTGTPRWTRFGATDMSPLGNLRVVNGARPYARQVAITLGSSWDGSLPMALSCVSLQ